jgi:hypothetical protein
MISSLRVPRSLRHCLSEEDSPGWCGTVRAAATSAASQVPLMPYVGALRDLIDGRVQERLCRDDYLELEAALNAALGECFDAASLLGFALARTWPDRAEAFDEWPLRALGYAGLLGAGHDDDQQGSQDGASR